MSKFMFVHILIREKMLFWKSRVSDSESCEYQDSFEKYFGSFPSSHTPKLCKLLKSLFIDMFIFWSQFNSTLIWISKCYLCHLKELHISFLRLRQTSPGSQWLPRSVTSVCQRRVKLNLRLFIWVMFDSFPGKYLVREEVEKAPTYDDQPCQLTETAVKISFPEEMRSEIFVNLLGYKEPNLLHLKRWENYFGNQEKAGKCTETRLMHS